MVMLFHPGIPRSLNVDMEWLYGASETSNMEVDIGYIPQVSTRVPLPKYIHCKALPWAPPPTSAEETTPEGFSGPPSETPLSTDSRPRWSWRPGVPQCPP